MKTFLSALLVALALPVLADGRVNVLFTNDAHTHVDGGNVSYAQIAAFRDSLEERDEHTILVDAGDFMQGSAFGKIDRGASVVGIMNAAGYQVVAIGNHEFDYGMGVFLRTAKDLCRFPLLSCNLWKTNAVEGTRERVLPAYAVVTSGTVRVAFVGVTTPETLTFASPKCFLDPSGSYRAYDFDGSDNPQDLYDSVQRSVDAAARESDVVIVLGHLGLGAPGEPWKSPDIIAHTTNYIAFVDGHSHTPIAASNVLNAAGRPVRLVQSGSRLNALGILTIESGSVVDSKLITSLTETNDSVRAQESALIAKIDAWLGQKLAVSDVAFSRYGRSKENAGETNLGDFATDAFWWFANVHSKVGCDLALCNYAGLRVDVSLGDFTLRTANDICPFGNNICIIEATGAQLRDALEWGARKMPDYSGGLLLCAGLRYEVVTSRPSTVASHGGVWMGGPTNGVYRVSGIEVYDSTKKRFVPIVPEKTYRIAGGDYTLRNCAEGFAMFKSCRLVEESLQLDYLVLAAYAKAFAKGKDGWPHLRASFSPLAALPGYPIDYASRGGSRRIVRRETEER